jgi:photosynthetic reaction center cytochrome c subunit
MQIHRTVFASLLLAAGGILVFSWQAMAQSAGAGSAQSTAPAAPQATPAKPKTASEAYKNIQVLKDIRADQLLPSMRYMTVALGVRCDFCHVPDHFDQDEKSEKATAREMMKMVMAVDSDNFHGRREVTCYTCHAGHSHPMSIPALPEPGVATVAQMTPASTGSAEGHAENHGAAPANAAAAPATPMPTVDQILAKYTEALGGEAAIQKLESRSEKGTVDVPTRNFHATMEVYRKAPDKALAILHTQGGDVTEGYDGTTGWESRGNRTREEAGDELVRVQEWAAFFAGLDLKKDYSRAMLNGIEKLDGEDAYRVFAWRKGGGLERLYFDAQTGLLVRLDTRIDSPLGALPQETDYQDYRDVGGVKIPATVRVARVDATTTYKWDTIEPNVSVADSRFAMPEMKAEEKASGSGAEK